MELFTCEDCLACDLHHQMLVTLGRIDQEYLKLAQDVQVTEDASWLQEMDTIVRQRSEYRKSMIDNTADFVRCKNMSIIILEDE
jgi:hypothetical protein